MKYLAVVASLALASCGTAPSPERRCISYRSIPRIADEFGMTAEVCVRREGVKDRPPSAESTT
jgi:hypothetical protein